MVYNVFVMEHAAHNAPESPGLEPKPAEGDLPSLAIPLDPPIYSLPMHVVNQIAAGEVVERPASVVKELIENAIDAAGWMIRIELEEGGIELVRVVDNGWGIRKKDLPKAVASHATCKIRTSKDLDSISTFGFRGEALASIASVSRLSIRSHSRADPDAWQLDVEGGKVGSIVPASGPEGTSVTVRNLFYNVPARRKFLKTVRTEQMRCMEVIRNAALANARIGFEVFVDGRCVLELPDRQQPRDRAIAVLGRELIDQVVEVHVDEFFDDQGMALWGVVGLPAVARGSAKAQHFFVNGRPIRDRTISHALNEAYRGLAEPGRFPTAVLMLDMSPEGVDVNVHPQKAEVRFRNASRVHSVIYHAVRDALAQADLTPRFALPGNKSPKDNIFSSEQILPSDGHDVGFEQRHEGQQGSSQSSAARFASFLRGEVPSQPQQRLSYQKIKEAIERVEQAGRDPKPTENQAARPDTQSIGAVTSGDAGLVEPPRPGDRILQVHNSYLVTQDEQGVLIIDQHALHERVMFEVLLGRIANGPLESQQLLMPAIIKPGAEGMERLESLKPLLTKIGIEVKPMGPETLGVQAFATFLFERKVDPVEFVTELFEKTDREGFVPDSEEALREVLDMMACKAAVKAGDHMSEEELEALLTLRREVERTSNCPHGRPTTIRLSISDLERLFGRT